MPKISLRSVLVFAALHFVLFMTATLFALAGLGPFDDAAWSFSLVGRIAEVFFQILIQPMMLIFVLVAEEGAGIPDALEWTLVVANSLLWGVGLSFLRVKWLQRRNSSER